VGRNAYLGREGGFRPKRFAKVSEVLRGGHASLGGARQVEGAMSRFGAFPAPKMVACLLLRAEFLGAGVTLCSVVGSGVGDAGAVEASSFLVAAEVAGVSEVRALVALPESGVTLEGTDSALATRNG
jgi:hypothetical protein